MNVRVLRSSVCALLAAVLLLGASTAGATGSVVAGRLIVKFDDAISADVGAALRSRSFRSQAPDTTLDELVQGFGVQAARRLFVPDAATLVSARAQLGAVQPRGARQPRATGSLPGPLAVLANIWVLEMEDGPDPAAAARAFAADPHVVYAHADYLGEAATLPDDPLLTCAGAGCEPPDPRDSAWGTWQWALHRMKAPTAWDQATGQGVVVAVIDSGVNRDHADMGLLWTNDDEVADGGDTDTNGFIDDTWGWDFVTCNRFDLTNPEAPVCTEANTPDADPSDEEGHGTAVAAICGAATGNGLLMAGVAHGARIMALRAMNNDLRAASSEVMAALVYAAANGADIASMSVLTPYSDALRDAVEAVAVLGVLQVAAAGNSGDGTLFYPAGFADVVAVASTDSFDGASDFSTFNDDVQLSAPGDNVLSLLGLDPGSSDVHGGLFGTSMATPHVAGVAALLWEWQPALTAKQVGAALCTGAQDLGEPGRDPHFGCGRVDALATLQTQCVLDVCGDGVHETGCGEQCDDGNVLDGDCCSPTCELEGIGAACQIFTKDERRCQEALAGRGRLFATALHKAFEKCLKRFIKDLSGGKSTARAAAACRAALDVGDSTSTIARTRTKAEQQMAKKCDAFPPAAIGPPCDADALTMDAVVACLLDGHAASVGTMVANEYRDACTLLTVLGLAPTLPGTCAAP